MLFFIFAAKYYGSILYVLIGKNKIENRLNWRNFNNHNNRNHNGYNNYNNVNHNGFKTAPNGGAAETARNGGVPTPSPESPQRRGTAPFKVEWTFRSAREVAWANSPLWLRKIWKAYNEAFRSIIKKARSG